MVSGYNTAGMVVADIGKRRRTVARSQQRAETSVSA
jgi:hypothetical protein